MVEPRWPRFITAGLHKNISLLTTAFLGVHIATAVVDRLFLAGEALMPAGTNRNTTKTDNTTPAKGFTKVLAS